jgi:ABC-2 type transport system permease protein
LTAPISISRAAYLLTRLRLRRMLNQIGALSRYRMGASDRKASARASPIGGVFGVLVALAMLYGFTMMAYQSIANIERALGSAQVENAVRTDSGVTSRVDTAGRARSELSLPRAPRAPGSVLAARVLQGVTLEATLILATVLLGAIASRELVRPEWDLEWLVTLPLPLSTLICSMLVERVVANSLGFVFLGTFLSALAWKCGYGWAAPLLGIALTIGLLFLAATAQVLVDTGLRLVLQPPKLRNLQAVTSLVAVLPLLLVWSLAADNLFLLDWISLLPDWAKWLPSGLAVQALASNDAWPMMLWTAIMMAEVLVVVAIGSALLRLQLRNGVVAAGAREAVARRPRRWLYFSSAVFWAIWR